MGKFSKWLADVGNRSRIKKTSKHIYFHTDKDYFFDFFYKFTNDNDITILAFDTIQKTYREFVLDEVIIRAMFEVVDGKDITRDFRFINDKMTTPDIAKDYIDAGFTLIKKTGDSRFANVAVLGKVGTFGNVKETKKAFILRRIVYNNMLVIGVDTLALPLGACKAFIKRMETIFKAERALTKRQDTKGGTEA